MIPKKYATPKQWARWTKKAGLKSSNSSNLVREFGRFCFSGHDRFWDLTRDGGLIMSPPKSQYHYQANFIDSVASVCDVKNEREFVELVHGMLKGAQYV